MVGPDSSHGVSRVVHHKDFYLRGGDMTVLVENHLYRIHSYFFERESLFFRQKFNNTINGGDEERVGSTDNNAYTLEDIKSEDFARFLWVFYNPKYSIYDAPLDTWLSILKLANLWTFDNVKELSIQELEKIEIEPVEKISIYHNNSISRLYLIPSYIAVCKRDKPLTFTEGMSLGMETVLRIAEARERLRLQASESGIRTPTFEDFEDGEVEVLIREIFNLGSRPTSPIPATSPANGIAGPSNGVIKLGPAPPGNAPKANGALAPRANGVSAADPKGASVDSLPSIASIMSSQAAATATPSTAQRPAQQTVQQNQIPPAPLAKPMSATPTLPSPVQASTQGAADKTEDKLASKDKFSLGEGLLSPKSGGAGEPSSSADLKACSTKDDDSISKPVVPSSEHSNHDSNDNVDDAKKDDLGKDNDTASVFSDVDGPKQNSRQATKRKSNNRGNPSAKNKPNAS